MFPQCAFFFVSCVCQFFHRLHSSVSCLYVYVNVFTGCIPLCRVYVDVFTGCIPLCQLCMSKFSQGTCVWVNVSTGCIPLCPVLSRNSDGTPDAITMTESTAKGPIAEIVRKIMNASYAQEDVDMQPPAVTDRWSERLMNGRWPKVLPVLLWQSQLRRHNGSY